MHDQLKDLIERLKKQRSKLFKEKHASPQILIDKTSKISQEIERLETQLKSIEAQNDQNQ